MKKRALSIVLTLALCLGMLPATAWAEQDPDPAPASQEVTSQATPAEQDVALEEQDTEEQDGESAENYVAQVGDQSYATLKEALDAAKNGGTVKLLTNASLGENDQEDVYTLGDGESLTIDLAGKTLSGSFDIGRKKQAIITLSPMRR